jgi:deoxyribonuclease V
MSFSASCYLPKHSTARILGCKCSKGQRNLTAMDINRARLIQHRLRQKKIAFPYIPGYQSFREAPVLIEALKKLEIKPDLILVDGQGIAHPRGQGLASHLGILMNIPTIGCAKTRLVGDYEEPGKRKGDWSPLILDQEVIGAVLRTRDRISPGHRIDIACSIKIIPKATPHLRISEPLRKPAF